MARNREDAMLAGLAAFRATQGHCRVPIRWAGDPARLGFWCSQQRSLFKKGELTTARTEKLAALGFFDPVPTTTPPAPGKTGRRKERNKDTPRQKKGRPIVSRDRSSSKGDLSGSFLPASPGEALTSTAAAVLDALFVQREAARAEAEQAERAQCAARDRLAQLEAQIEQAQLITQRETARSTLADLLTRIQATEDTIAQLTARIDAIPTRANAVPIVRPTLLTPADSKPPTAPSPRVRRAQDTARVRTPRAEPAEPHALPQLPDPVDPTPIAKGLDEAPFPHSSEESKSEEPQAETLLADASLVPEEPGITLLYKMTAFFYEGDQLVVVTDPEGGEDYLGLLAEEGEESLADLYVGIAITTRRLQQVLDGTLDVRTAFLERECPDWIRFLTADLRNAALVGHLQNGAIPEAYLPPTSDFFLSLAQ